jgi:hypothetical protein
MARTEEGGGGAAQEGVVNGVVWNGSRRRCRGKWPVALEGRGGEGERRLG